MNHKRIGLLGGSFDPLHFGHLNMAIALSETHRLDSVLFCPAYTSPFKTENPPAVSTEHRLAMVSCGIQGVQHFSTLDWEIAQNGPSYTIDTIKKLKDESAAELFFASRRRSAIRSAPMEKCRRALHPLQTAHRFERQQDNSAPQSISCSARAHRTGSHCYSYDGHQQHCHPRAIKAKALLRPLSACFDSGLY